MSELMKYYDLLHMVYELTGGDGEEICRLLSEEYGWGYADVYEALEEVGENPEEYL